MKIPKNVTDWLLEEKNQSYIFLSTVAAFRKKRE